MRDLSVHRGRDEIVWQGPFGYPVWRAKAWRAASLR
jgi:hypothetical protein